MGILAIQYRTAKDSPILVVANREEQLSRPSQGPRIQSGRPRVVCGIDKKAGGTWGGVNQHGLFVTVLNCSKRIQPYDPRSRGLLCRELLACRTAEEALDKAVRELATGCYEGANFLCVDRTSGGVVYGGDEIEVERLTPGLHVLTSNRMDDYNDTRQEFVRRLLTLQRLDSSISFMAVASRAFSRCPDDGGRRGIIISEPDYGTVSSILLSLTDRTHRSVMQYADGRPDNAPFEDVSALLRQVLSTERSLASQQQRQALAAQAAAAAAAGEIVTPNDAAVEPKVETAAKVENEKAESTEEAGADPPATAMKPQSRSRKKT
ncbi:MAG: NRDE family protein [Planctomycetaceae bacterium]|jgi:hypothetical protein|nr:NRDE family protein [Planctomycetaceae bacterium]